jgi:hypothetical protein
MNQTMTPKLKGTMLSYGQQDLETLLKLVLKFQTNCLKACFYGSFPRFQITTIALMPS